MVKYFTLLFSSLVMIFQPGYSAPSTDDKLEIVIFGATGDLTSRKILPALYHLAESGDLPSNTSIIAIGRRDLTNEQFREDMHAAVKSTDTAFWKTFEKTISYHNVDIEKDRGFDGLAKRLDSKANRLFFLATAPKFFPDVVKKLHDHHMIYDGGDDKKWSRVIIEKPFGEDLASAVELQKEISKYLSENQIYRVDHYLGKDGVRNLLQFRFSSGLFEPLWNKQYIDNVQITISENIGIGTRAQFWEETGLLRDIMQNHLMQMLALFAMETPQKLEPKKIHAEKIKLLDSIRPLNPSEVIRGQYGPGNGALGYLQEKGVPPTSKVETFVAAKLMIDNNRWKDVPFYVRSGKRMPVQTAEIVVNFKDQNSLTIRIQPDTGIFFNHVAKVSGLDKNDVAKPEPEAYEKLLLGCIQGDSSLFVEADEQLAAWRLLTPVLDYWKKHPNTLQYDAGTWGPKEADRLLQKDGRNWNLTGVNLMKTTISEIVEPNTLMATRYSSYAYDANQPVSKEQIEALVKSARLAPSSYNDQPWNFIICDRNTNKEAYDKALSTLMEANQAWAKNAPVLIITVASSMSSRGTPNPWGQYDSGAAAFSMMLQANSMGLNAHQMGGFYADQVRKLFEIPENFVPMSVMAVGYPEKQTMPEKKRRSISDNFFNGAWARGFS